MAAYDRQKFRLKQEPIDNWSTREKLALATGVQKIGNQNWGPVVRQLKAFADKNRPSDWFSPKFCALQYNDMFDKIEAPKRKRGERGEETTQDLIVKKYTTERLKELEQSLRNGFEEIAKIGKTLDKLRSNNYDDEFFKGIIKDIKRKEQKKKDGEMAHQKWLAEREIKLSQISMKFRGGTANIPKQSLILTTIKVEASSKENQTLEKTSVVPDKQKVPSETTENFVDNVKRNDNNEISTTTDTSASISQSVPSPKKEIIADVVIVENKNDDEKTQRNQEAEKIVEITLNPEKIISPIDVVSDSDQKDNKIESINSEATSIDFEITNEESSETNETVVDDATMSVETKIESEVNVIETNLKNQKVSEPEIKSDPNESSSNDIENFNDNANYSTVDKEQNNNSITIEEQQIKSLDQSLEDQTDIATNEKSGRRKRRRINLNSSKSNFIQTRSTRSNTQNEQQIQPIEAVVIVKKEEDTKQHPIKRRTLSTNEESSSAAYVNFSEESNESKTNIEQTLPRHDSDIDAKWKKASLIIVRTIQNHRCVPLITKPFESKEEYKDAIFRQMDINSIRKRIENGHIRSNDEFKRDLMLMFVNAIMLNHEPTVVKTLVEFAKETLDLFETSETPKVKTRDKSHTPEVEKFMRRQTRGSISNENERIPRSSKKPMKQTGLTTS